MNLSDRRFFFFLSQQISVNLNRVLGQVHFVSRTVPLLAFRDFFQTSSRITIVVPFDRRSRSGWSLFGLTESSSGWKFDHLPGALAIDACTFRVVITDAGVTYVAGARISFDGIHLGVATSGLGTSIGTSLLLNLVTTFLRLL